MEQKLKEEEEKVRKFAEDYARKNNFGLNPNTVVRESVITGLARNKIKYGYRYCPCRIVTGNFAEDKLKICPCHWHREEIARDGHCHCQLFFSPEAIKSSRD